MSQLDKLIKKRATIKSKVTIFNKFVLNLENAHPNKIISEPSIMAELEQRLGRFLGLIDEFEDVQSTIDEISENVEEQESERETFYGSVGKAKVFTGGVTNVNPSTENVMPSNSGIAANSPVLVNVHENSREHDNEEIFEQCGVVKLPVIDLPHFDGKHAGWLEFRDSFESLINKNTKISQIQKFHYLRASLSGSASQIIANLDFSSNNYKEAWSLLCKRYNNSRILTQILLSTVLLNVYDKNNKLHVARALLDSGSQSNFMTSDFSKILQLPQTPIEIKVCGINQVQSNIKHTVLVEVKSRFNMFSSQMSCLVVPQISNDLPNFKVNIQGLQIPGNIQLADPKFHLPDRIDMLLGAECFWQIMCVGQIKLGSHGPILQKTKFGWIVSGTIPSSTRQVTHCHFSRNSETDKQIARFWEIEEVSNVKPLSHEEKLCETHFVETVRRDASGRFVVTIPLKDNPAKLGDSYENAKGRLLSLERKFSNNSDFKSQYCQFMNEYRNFGHMSKVTNNGNINASYFMPHHGVIKKSSLTTKLRVVFDASCPSSSGYSFNDIQMVGPQLQPDLFTILLRHRRYNYVIAGDIEKMYRMCLVKPEQRCLQRILWRDDPEKPIDVYELATVTYGTASAAYLAIRCLYQLGLDCKVESPKISKVIKNHFYVDDLLTGGDSIEEVIVLANEVARVLKSGGFILRKWVSNSPDVLRGIKADVSAKDIDFGVRENTKTLGLIWDSHTDSFAYKISTSFSSRVTKRSMLSEIAQIFDPLGLLSPCIISAKILLQDLWSENLTWDESLPHQLHTKWLQIRDELNCLNTLRIPRQAVSKNLIELQIHGFSDASTKAYGACVYLRSQDRNGEILTRLICAKSKVAPLKTQKVPRLELMAALLLAQLVDKVKPSLDLTATRIVYWCDSSVVLGWLKMSPSILQTFVANRVARIQEFSDHDWRYVPTTSNPADHVSRGVKPSALPSLDMYWNGPEWLSKNESSWPLLLTSKCELPELRKSVETLKTTTEFPDFPFEKYSDLTRLERIIAYCLRFRSNCSKPKTERKLGPLTVQETEKASLCLVRISQASSFNHEISVLETGNELNAKNQISKLNPFVENRVLRVGGRLANSNFPYDKKHPILLSSKQPYTKLLFKREHKRLMHAGPQHLLASIRDKFWPMAGRNLARKIVHECVQCFRARPRMINPIMGNLPSKRVIPASPFHTTGVDYAGPFSIKDRNGRGRKVTKCYVSLFVCFLTRAIHLELVTDLTKEAFLAAFRRFIARRGRPRQMYSDNGKNFIGADLELQALGRFLQANSCELTDSIQNEGVAWSFIPAHSPHFGGIWEAGVKSMKHHLRRVAGNALLTFEQFYTLLVQVESILNSRPISPLSSDPSDYTPLTPSHFLIGRPMTAAADPDLTDVPVSRLSHFQRIQQLQQHFWTRWSREYIAELQQRTKWTSQNGALKVNDLVAIKDDNQPPTRWKLGRIVAVHPGPDGVARVATIKTSTGTIKRSFSKICPLPIET